MEAIQRAITKRLHLIGMSVLMFMALSMFAFAWAVLEINYGLHTKEARD